MSKHTATIKAEKFSLGSELSCLRSLTTEKNMNVNVKNILHFSCVISREIHNCISQ